MAETQVIDLDFQIAEGNAEAATSALKNLESLLSDIEDGMGAAFSVKGLTDYKKSVARFGKDLADELLVLQLSFGKMRYAIAEAVAPVASVFLPAINSAIQGVIRFSSSVNQFFRGIIAGITGRQELAESADTAAKSEEKLASAAKSAGRAVKRSLAGFDQLERLNGSSGSGSSGSSGETIGSYVPDGISSQVQAVVDRVLALLEPLMAIDLQPLQQALQTLAMSFQSLAEVAGEGMLFLWQEILTPFTAWVLETLAPALTTGWAAALEFVTAAISPLVEGIGILWESLKPVVAFIGESVITALQAWQQQFRILTGVFTEKHPVIVGIFQNISRMVTQMWAVAGPILSELRNHFTNVFSSVSRTVGTAIGYILEMLSGLTGFLAGVFTGNWEQAWQGVVLFLKSAVNGVITLLNSMISRLVNALNAVVGVANKLSFTVPAWVPGYGGKKFGVNLPYVSAPQIPYLAKGAVLPAGKPFLAVVGDQHHGTNVEAPLHTIQEAVALVMEDQTGAILRGFEASIGVQQEILQAVLGIHIGDEVIGQAVSRYQQKMAVVRGG